MAALPHGFSAARTGKGLGRRGLHLADLYCFRARVAVCILGFAGHRRAGIPAGAFGAEDTVATANVQAMFRCKIHFTWSASCWCGWFLP